MADSESLDGGSGSSQSGIPDSAGASAFQNLPGGEGGWLHSLILYAAREPREFCFYVVICLSPLFCISAMLSWKLAKAIEAQEKDKQKKSKKAANINKVKRGKAD